MRPATTALILTLLLLVRPVVGAFSLAPLDQTAPHLTELSRGVDQVAPAVTNATAVAFEKAQTLLARYSDTLRVIAIPTGLLIAFFGYFLLAPVLFIAAFISGGGLCFVAVSAVLGEDTPAAVWISIAAMLLGGAMLGFLALRALNVGMFAVGAALGVVLASALKATLITQAYPSNPQLAFILASILFGVVFGLLAICLQKHMLIFSTAYAGSCACMFGIGHFAGHFPTSEDISDVEAGHLNGWLFFYIIMTIAIGSAGMFFQFWLSRNKPMPRHAPNDRRRRRSVLRQYVDDDWSDEDDWMDDHYRERVPLPPRKHHPYPYHHSDDNRPHLQTPRPQSAPVKIDRPELQEETVPNRFSWNSVRSAVNIFEQRAPEEPVRKVEESGEGKQMRNEDIGTQESGDARGTDVGDTKITIDAEDDVSRVDGEHAVVEAPANGTIEQNVSSAEGAQVSKDIETRQ